MYDEKEEYAMDEVESGECLTITKQGKILMKKQQEMTALTYSQTIVSFQNLVEERSLSAGEDPSVKRNLVQPDSIQNVWGDQDNGNTEYVVCELAYMKDVAQDLGDMMR